MEIRDITLQVLVGEASSGPPEEERVGRPLDIYPEFRDAGPRARRAAQSDGPVPVEQIYLRISTDGDTEGVYGPVDAEAAFPILHTLRPFLLGRDPLPAELLWDQMFRLDRHGRSGHLMMAISAVDNCLWDLRGKHFGEPVYRLLGGPTRPAIPAYASMLGHSLEPDRVRTRAIEMRDRGFTAQKWFFRRGPDAGGEGRRENLELARTLRETLGEAYGLMFDAFMAWDVQYGVSLARELLAVNPLWLEEPLSPADVEGYARIKREAGIPLAGGEHLYTRCDVLPYLRTGALDYVQSDPDWCGGITELLKVCALAAPFGAKVVPHGHTLIAAAHVVAAQPPGLCPFVEYLVRFMDRKQFFHANPLVASDGLVPLPSGPGLGIALDEARITARRDLDWR